jgi:xylose isomerase
MNAHFNYSTRLNSFKSRPELYEWIYGRNDVRDLIARSSKVRRLDGYFLNYPEHFVSLDLPTVRSFIFDKGFRVFGLNLRFPEDQFRAGAFTNPDLSTRQAGLDLCKRAVDACRELGGNHVSLWLGYDGIDYPLQADYREIWEHEIEGLRVISDYAGEIRISVEYKPSDPRRHSLLDSMGITLASISEINTPNLGITIDYCHMLMAKEIPSLSAMLALRHKKLFGVHLNDGYGYQDDGLMVGTTSSALTKELFYYLLTEKYEEPIYFDTFPVREDPIIECEANIDRVEQICAGLEETGTKAMEASLRDQDAFKAVELTTEWRI